MATARATSNATTKNTNPPNNPPNNPPERSPASSEPHFEVKIMVWLLSILVILFILNNHLSSASSKFQTPRRSQKGEAGSAEKGRPPGSAGKRTPGSAGKRTPGSAKKRGKSEKEKAAENWDADGRYFVLNLNWGPDFVDENFGGGRSLAKLQDHIRDFNYSFTIHNFRMHRPDGSEPRNCVEPGDIEAQRRDMELELELRIPLRLKLDAYWPTFNEFYYSNNDFWWHEW